VILPGTGTALVSIEKEMKRLQDRDIRPSAFLQRSA